MLSLICPTKNRPNNVLRLVENLYDTVTENMEIIFIYDKEEKSPLYTLTEIKNSVSINILNREPSDFLNKDYYNYGVQHAKGDILWCIGDDIIFKTRNWSTILKERIEEYLKDKPDRIAYISVNEVNSRAKHPCFPLITKEAFQALGMYFHPDLMSWGADRCLYELYSGINRMLHIPEVEIQHLSYHDNSGVFDETAKSMKERFFRDPNCHNKVCSEIIPKQIEMLKQIIGGKINDS